MYGIVGVVKGKKEELKNYGKKIIVASNHVSAFDILGFYAFLDRIEALVDEGFYKHASNFVTANLQKILGTIYLPSSKNEGEREGVRNSLRSHFQKERAPSEIYPLVFFPEGWDTSGKYGTLIFQKFLFSLNVPIALVSIKASVPFLPIQISKLGTFLTKEVLLLFFLPCKPKRKFSFLFSLSSFQT